VEFVVDKKPAMKKGTMQEHTINKISKQFFTNCNSTGALQEQMTCSYLRLFRSHVHYDTLNRTTLSFNIIINLHAGLVGSLMLISW